jgi:hypothetical protein
MTITSTTSRMPPYAGNGSATAFPVTIPFPDADSIRAILARPGQADAELVRDTDFTLTGAGDPAGGTLAFPKAGSAYSVLASGETLHILRVLPLTQERDWDNVDALDAEQIEAGDDRLTMLCQQLQEQLDRAVQWPATGTGETDAAAWLATATSARDQAVAAQASAEAAEFTALAAQAGAQAAQSAAGLAETGAAASASAAQASLAATVSARDAALAAQSGAATERAAAQAARTGAEAAQAGAVAARTGAEAARDAAADSAGIAANWAAVAGTAVGDYGRVTEPEGVTYDYGGVI